MEQVERRSFERDGLCVVVVAYNDPDYSPLEFAERGGEDDELIDSWERGDWHYVGIMAHVETEDGLTGPESGGIWGMEYGYRGNYDYPFRLADPNDPRDWSYTDEEINEAITLYRAALEKAAAGGG